MNRFIVVHTSIGGMAELYNVGFFDAKTPEEAEKKARKQWNTTESLFVMSTDELCDGWSFYI